MLRGKRRRRLEDHLARILPKGIAPTEIGRLTVAAVLYHSMANLDARHFRHLRLTGDDLASESGTILTLVTPFCSRLGWHKNLVGHRIVALPVPRDRAAGGVTLIAEALAGVSAAAPLYFARYSRLSIGEEALHLTRLDKAPSGEELGQYLSDALNLNPAYYHWLWSLELHDGQSS